jgi:uncharacterized protein YecT (DUF1311 family)
VCKEEENKKQQHLSRANDYLAAQQYDKAEKEYRRVLKGPSFRIWVPIEGRKAETRERSILCETSITEPQGAPLLVCADADLAFWQKLVSEIYQHRWKQLDANGQKILRQDQLDWLLRDMRVHCNAAFQASVSGTEMARAKSCVLQSTKERIAVLSNN